MEADEGSQGKLGKKAAHYIIPINSQRMEKYNPRKIICFGDSITQRGNDELDGWVSSLSNEYIRKLDVVNRGFSG
jgi:lysophospholipase L1-like esterase